ncbi:MAG: rane protein [Gemmatimonadetes bacterium]|nr:rane protein [Gemmatimonadota bacterium]
MIRRLIAVGLALLLAAPPLDPLFDVVMGRHLLGQVPALLLLGAVAGWPPARGPVTARPLAGLAFAIGAIAFWMIPRSLDAAVRSNAADQLLHLSMFTAGLALARVLPRLPVPVSLGLGVHAVAMVGALGLVYRYYPGLICTTYNLTQQRAAGLTMVRAAPLLWLGLWAWAVSRAGRNQGPRHDPSPAAPAFRT